MIRTISNLTSHLSYLFSHLLTRPIEDPIRSELFSSERFDQHARSLAVAQTITKNPKSGTQLTPRLRENEKILQASYRYLTREVQNNKTINPAGEWLIDSFFVVEEQLRDIKRYLPDDFYNELPKLAEGFLAGYPRVYGLAWAYVAHTDSRFDAESLSNFVRSYQQVQPLTIGELWALAITLRVVMIDNLRRIASYLVTSQEARQHADIFADELLGLIEESSKKTRPSAAKLKKQSVHPAFLVQLIQRLRYQDPKGIPAVSWLNEQLAEKKTTADEIVTSVHNQQSANNQTVRNIITSFRTMTSFDWQDFFEQVSPVHKILCGHTNFMLMDFITRNSYRSAVEELAKGSKRDELEIAHLVIQKAMDADAYSERLQDPGYYLLGEGRPSFEKEIRFKVHIKNRLVRFCTDHPASVYIGYVSVLTLLILAVAVALNPGLPTPLLLALLTLGLFPASDLAVSRVNRFITKLIPPHHLSRLEFLDGPPTGFRTFVVVPTILGTESEIPDQLEKLEVHYLSNPEGDVRFALLTDFPDSMTELSSDDLQKLTLAELLVESLNLKHGPAPDDGPRFFLFHRKRLWNPLEGKWMGWERKRGKLHEFNQLLRQSEKTTYFNPKGVPVTTPLGVRYVITLDSDTKLPPGVVSQLVGILAHPLHRAHLDPVSHKVIAGYGILQPRVTSFLPSQNEKSLFQKLFSGECGIDPYASAVSDVYQDLFGEGSFTGKGIYDLDAYETALEGRIPENSLLSHDLFEGSFARCGYASDLEFFEDFPSHAEISTARNHRWVRGDWQLLPWLFGRGKADLSILSRWKMLDNLRRSLSPIAAIGIFLIVFAAHAALPAVWLGLTFFALALPSLITVIEDMAFWRTQLHWRDQLGEIKRDFFLGTGQVVVNLVLLANRAWMHLDAVARTLWRLWISHRNLLEWVTAAQAKSAASLSPGSFWRRMKGSVGIALLSVLITVLFNPRVLPICLPFVVLWIGAPWFARFISLPESKDKIVPLIPAETEELRLYGRRIWRFFKTFAESEDNFLPPDNFQEDPQPVTAHRSSPTNFGLHLLSIVTARDFGWCGLVDMTDYLERTLNSLKTLPRHRGHFYNWYDTRTRQVLEPQYISSVDSGNLAGHLLTLAQSCQDIAHQPLFSREVFAGIQDSMILLKKSVLDLSDHGRTAGTPLSQLQKEIRNLEEKLSEITDDPFDRVNAHWESLGLQAETMKDTAHAFASEQRDDETHEMIAWADMVAADIESHAKDFQQFFSWIYAFSDTALLTGDTDKEKELQLAVQRLLSSEFTLAGSPIRYAKAIDLLESLRQLRVQKQEAGANDIVFDQVIETLTFSIKSSLEMLKRLNAISALSRSLFNEMDFSFLLNSKKKLFSVGYRVADDQLDESCYDLLASEARLTSYVAIIKGDVPVSHWFRLGRGLVADEGEAMLVSWSGSMFEYLMPYLIMTSPDGSLLDQTCERVVKRQIQYGHLRGVPWGISEAGYNVRDLNFAYQYSNFGVPGLGLKRGLVKDLVIAPYATALASMVDPQKALQNLKRLENLGATGAYGFYESLDYTANRVREHEKFELVRSYMAHHQGMSLLSFSNVVHDGLLRRRFNMDPLVQAGELLLQERTPRNLGAIRDQMKEVEVHKVHEPMLTSFRKIRSPHHPIPSSHLLSNGRYAVMMTAAGSGYSLWKNRAVTRWREDASKDNYGNYLFLRDMQSDVVWSAAYQPTLVEPLQYETFLSEDQVKISRLDYSIFTDMEVLVSAEDDAELRRITLTNHSPDVREIEITSYTEVVLAPADADIAHPAFSNLFIETGFLPALSALTATRRPRASTDERVFMAQVISSEGETLGDLEYETDRSKFIGRGRQLRKAISVMDGRALSNTVGAVLDPIMSMRVKVRLQPGTSAKICFTTLVAGSETEMLAMAEKYHNPSAFERSSNLVWTQSKAKLHHLGIDLDEAEIFQKLANRIIFSDPLMRPTSEILKMNHMNVTGLWSRGISGDLPILLVRIDDLEDQSLIRQLLRAHEYWRMKRLSVDIVILNEKATSYVQDLQTSLEGMARSGEATSAGNPDLPPGKIYVLRNDLLDSREKQLLLTVARAILHNRQGTLAEQVMRMRKTSNYRSIHNKRLNEMETFRLQNRVEVPLTVPQLEFFNGIGGFANHGKEYVIVLEKGQRTPAPWVNVIANPDFGFLVSESGAGYTWSLNSRENQITSWFNDPVVDPVSEAFFISDLDSDQIWSPTASPIRLENTTYIAKHGAGYSVFENGSNEIHSQLTQFADQTDPIKISRLILENTSDEPRRLLVTGYVEWVLGFTRSKTAPFVITERDEETGSIFATNPLNTEFGSRVSFFGINANQTNWTADRAEFIGRNGTMERPAGLLRKEKLSGTTGAGYDPCGVLQVPIELAPGEKKEISFFLGQAESQDSARRLVQKYRRANLETTLQTVTQKWDRLLGKTQVQTPDRAMDILLNRWLLYQTLSCRFWARTAFYQAGGAIGFRDQLQDVMAIMTTDPQLARAHILKTAARQFPEGDVQHWWHPPTGRGVRTRITDDRLWLPYVVMHYLKTTEDQTILDELVPFIDGAPLREGQDDSYYEPTVSREPALPLYEHCVRAINVSLKMGVHDLPLMGSGDWNDGMNRVGHEGKGESIWLGWFLVDVLTQMAPLAEQRGDTELQTTWVHHATQLKTALETNSWDGEWYKRAYFDDGFPLGSKENTECQIDSIAQTWAVLSGAGDPKRSLTAMQSMSDHLIRPKDKLILLFTPPFNQTPKDPGYIKGYLPGVRENGGQYTHAAAWTVCAYAKLGIGDKAHELFTMLNPINHALTRTNVSLYKSEPYVMAADVYGQPPHVGRGGWTWYTGSAGWMYRAGMEFILGIEQQGNKLHLNPCIPEDWSSFKATYQYGKTTGLELKPEAHDWDIPTVGKTIGTTYEIHFENPNHVSQGIKQIQLDGEIILSANGMIELKDDQKKHVVKIVMGI